MTTKELTDTIVSDLIAEIPIENRNAQDKVGIEEEMSALIYSHVERYRQQMVEKASEWMKANNGKRFNGFDIVYTKFFIDEFRKAMLNENKE